MQEDFDTFLAEQDKATRFMQCETFRDYSYTVASFHLYISISSFS